MPQSLSANVVDIAGRRTYPATITWGNGSIISIEPIHDTPSTYVLPGFVDAHVHIESSMLVPTEFARASVVHGTVATVSDPHEIGNVLGVAGVDFMLKNAAQTPLRICFGAPSCVPATTFETAGSTITVTEVEALLADERIGYLSEMMNFPGVLGGDPECLAKIAAAQRVGKPVDGHAPGLRGAEAARYVAAGMTTDHECFTIEEARDKLAAGCKIAIREGSAARNFEALHPLVTEAPGMVMFCSDDKHPDELLEGHINRLAARAVALGHDVYDVLHAACVTPVEHYRLDVGQLRVGDRADFIEVDSLSSFGVLRTFIGGEVVAKNGMTLLPSEPVAITNQFTPTIVSAENLRTVPALAASAAQRLRVIEAIDGQLITRIQYHAPQVADGFATADTCRDLLKLIVVNRYHSAPVAAAFITGFGIRQGAMASGVAHDSQNVVAVGTNHHDLPAAINLVMRARGGVSCASVASEVAEVLPLPVAGLMATGSCGEVAQAYSRLDHLVKQWGSPLRAPFMTLSFMALLVIPELKLSDLGLFDGGNFAFANAVE